MANMMEMTGGEMAAGADPPTPRGRSMLTRAVADRGAEFELAAIRTVGSFAAPGTNALTGYCIVRKPG